MPSRTDVIDPNSVDAYTWDTLASGNVDADLFEQVAGAGLAAERDLFERGQRGLAAPPSASRKRQKVGVALTHVTFWVSIASRPSLGWRGNGATSVAWLAATWSSTCTPANCWGP